MSVEENYWIDVHEEDAQHTSESMKLDNKQYQENEQKDVAQLEQGKNDELNEAKKDTTDELVQLVDSLITPEQIKKNDDVWRYWFENLQHEIVNVEV